MRGLLAFAAGMAAPTSPRFTILCNFPFPFMISYLAHGSFLV